MSWGRVRANSPGKLASFLDSPDDVYGSGADLDATISGNTTMSSDMYYYNLTVNTGITLNTGGYRLFVKNVLTMGASSVVGLPGGSVATGTLKGGGAASANTTNSLGGNGASTTATAITAVAGGTAYYKYPEQAIRGWNVTASATTPTYLEGGAGGTGVGGGVVIIAVGHVLFPQLAEPPLVAESSSSYHQMIERRSMLKPISVLTLLKGLAGALTERPYT